MPGACHNMQEPVGTFRNPSELFMKNLFRSVRSRTFRSPVCGSRPPARRRRCTLTTGWRIGRRWGSLGFWARQAPRQSRAGDGRWGQRCRWRRRWWRVWRRRPVCPGRPWIAGSWRSGRWQQWTRPRQYPGRRWQHYFLSRCQWRRRRIGPGWQPPYWRRCLTEKVKRNAVLLQT